MNGKGRMMATVRRNPAFTLLEVLLALSLAAITIIAVTMAVRFQLRLVESGRTQVEQAQLARAIMHRIADDIRSTIRYDPMNTQGGSSGSSSGGSATGGGNNANGNSTGNSSSSSSSSSSSTSDSTSQYQPVTEGSDVSQVTDWPKPIPGLYGVANGIQVDVSRVPRLDQFNYTTAPVDGTSASSSSSLSDVTSDVKTVAYFLASGQSASVAGGPAQSGLMRRELDRAVTLFAAEQGSSLSNLDQSLDPMAPEVTDITFDYWDSNIADWDAYWDSQVNNGLPAAVRIHLTLRPASQKSAGTSWKSPASVSASNQKGTTYSLIVYLPNSLPDQNSQGGTSSSSDSSTDQSNSDTSQTPAGGSTPKTKTQPKSNPPQPPPQQPPKPKSKS
jgi:hypothetical protein